MTGLAKVESETRDLISPLTGEVIDTANPADLAGFVHETMGYVRAAYQAMEVAKRLLACEAARQGTGTLHLGETAVTITPPPWQWDVPELADGLRAAGCPEATVNEVIRETVEHKVDAKRADRLARANPAYRVVVERCRQRKDAAPTVTVRTETETGKA